MTEPSVTERPVPWRTIWAVIGSVAVTYLGYRLAIELRRLILDLVVALFFAVVLAPAVEFLERKVHLRRGLAVMVVVVVGLGLLVALLYAFIRPLADQASNFAKEVPTYVADARNGTGPIGDLVRRYNIEDYVKKNQDRLQKSLTDLGAPALHLAQSVFNGVVALLTVLVLSILLLIRGPSLVKTSLELVPERRREQVSRVAGDSARAVSGYVFGNLLISAIAGVSTWIILLVLGVPSAGVLGLFVAFADLIPLVGASLGAIPAVGFAALHSITAGIIVLVFHIVYQQFENHVLQVSIMAKTVRVSPLVVLISVLAGVELLGLLGALLAIPAAGVIQVVARDIYDEHRRRLKPVFTEGADEHPTVGPAPPTTGPAKKAPAKRVSAKKAPAKRAASARKRSPS
jgi:predicted PurR-regulated permease PerM